MLTCMSTSAKCTRNQAKSKGERRADDNMLGVVAKHGKAIAKRTG